MKSDPTSSVCRSDIGYARGRKLILIFGSAGLLAFLVDLFPPAIWTGGICWTGNSHRPFRFQVAGQGTGRLPNAKIHVIPSGRLWLFAYSEMQSNFPPTTTDAQGNATISVMCGAGGSKGFFGKTGRFGISHQLLVEADGYFPISVALENVADGHDWPLSKKSFDIKLVMFKKP